MNSSIIYEEEPISIDAWWVIVSSIFAFVLQIGFLLQSIGTVRTSSEDSVAVAATCGIAIGMIAWCGFGHGIAFGEDLGGVIGTDGFLLGNVGIYHRYSYIDLLGMLVVAGVPSTMCIGTLIERMPIVTNLLNVLLMSVFIYPVVVHWILGEGGWLRERGFLDASGSMTVASVGGVCGGVATWVIGPRLGRFHKKTGQALPLHGYHAGTLMVGIWFVLLGWVGFNMQGALDGFKTGRLELLVPSSGNNSQQLAMVDKESLFLACVAINTILGAVSGGLVGAVYQFSFAHTVELPCLLESIVGGSVIVSSCGAFVMPGAACILGGLGGFVSASGSSFLLHVSQVDDPQGTLFSYGVNSLLGGIAVGFFHQHKGLINTGSFSLLGIQVVGVVTVGLFVSVMQYLILLLFQSINVPLRLPVEVETCGTDAELSRGPVVYLALQSFNEYLNHQRNLAEELLTDKEGIRVLYRFLNEHGEKHLLQLYVAILQCEGNPTLETPENLKLIFKTFINKNAPNEVALQSSTREEFALRMNLHDDKPLHRLKEQVHRRLLDACSAYNLAGSLPMREYVLPERSHLTLPAFKFFESIRKNWFKSLKPGASTVSVLEQSFKDLQDDLKLLTQSVLLLGIPQSGKSVLHFQLRLAWQEQVHTFECMRVAETLRMNAIQAMQCLINGGFSLGLISDRIITNQKLNKEVDSIGSTLSGFQETSFSITLARNISRLWKSKMIKEVYKARMKFPHLENTEYVLENVERFANTSSGPFAPTMEDFINSYLPPSKAEIGTDLQQETQDRTSQDELIKRLKWVLTDLPGNTRQDEVEEHLDLVQHIVYTANINGYLRTFDQVEKETQFQASLKDLNSIFNGERVSTQPEDMVIHLVFTHCDTFEKEFESDQFAQKISSQLMKFSQLVDCNMDNFNDLEAEEAKKAVADIYLGILKVHDYDCGSVTVNFINTLHPADVKKFGAKLSSRALFSKELSRIAKQARVAVEKNVKEKPEKSILKKKATKRKSTKFARLGLGAQPKPVVPSIYKTGERNSSYKKARRRLLLATEGCPDPVRPSIVHQS